VWNNGPREAVIVSDEKERENRWSLRGLREDWLMETGIKIAFSSPVPICHSPLQICLPRPG
jgi:hypothetical protein